MNAFRNAAAIILATAIAATAIPSLADDLSIAVRAGNGHPGNLRPDDHPHDGNRWNDHRWDDHRWDDHRRHDGSPIVVINRWDPRPPIFMQPRPYFPAPVFVEPAPVIIEQPTYPQTYYPAPVEPVPTYDPSYAPPQPVASVPVQQTILCSRSDHGLVVGAAGGAAIGGAIGAASGGKHSWEKASGGAIIGMLVGGAMGHAVDDVDSICTAQAIAYAPVGQTVEWQPYAGGGYRVTPVAETFIAGAPCRQYRAETIVNGIWRTRTGTSCLRPDGSWMSTGY